MSRTTSFGQDRRPSPVDRLGVALSGRAVRRACPVEGRRLADVGCGYQATLARSLAAAAAHTTLVDVALAPDLRGRPDVTAFEGTVEEVLPTLADASFDVVLCLSVLEHLWEPADALGQLRRILAPGGTLVVNVPTWLGKRALELSAFRLGWSPAAEMDDHKWYFDPRDLWPLLVRAGFRPSRISCRRHKFGLNTFAVCRAEELPA